MDPEQRKKVEGWAREAGIRDEEIVAAVDMEMRMQMTDKIRERDDILVRNTIYLMIEIHMHTSNFHQ